MNRRNLLFFIFIIIEKISIAQSNILVNSGFEVPATQNDYPTNVLSAQYGINHPVLDKWLSDEDPAGIPGNLESPDWRYASGAGHSGNGYLRMSSYEMIEQQIDQGLGN